MDSQYYVQISQSIDDIDFKEWTRLINIDNDIAMNPRLILLLENSLKDQARFWTVLVRNNQNQLVACACLSLFHTDIAQSSSTCVKNFVKLLREYWRNAFKLKVLFCGLPLPCGHTHLRIRPQEPIDKILMLINKTMLQLARQEQAQLLVFKEMDYQQNCEWNLLENLGYVSGELEPIYQFTKSFKNFSDYQAALRSDYRYKINNNLKKFKKADLKVEHIHHPEEISRRFTEEVHRLYLNVWENAKEKLECFPAAFFRHLPQVLPHQVVFTMISDNQKPVAFALGIVSNEIYHNLYVGLDYNYLERVDLYFNLYYHELDNVFALNKNKIYLGQTSAWFKSRLGALPERRYFWVLPMNTILRIIFKFFQKWIFPKVTYLEKNVFRVEEGNLSKETI